MGCCQPERVCARWGRDAWDGLPQRRMVPLSQLDLLHSRDARRLGAHVEVTARDVAPNGSAADVALVDVTARMVSARDAGAVVSRDTRRRRAHVEVALDVIAVRDDDAVVADHGVLTLGSDE